MKTSGAVRIMSLRFSQHMTSQCFLRIGAAFVLTALGFACSSASAGNKTTLRIWAMGREGEVLSQLIPGFEKEHPDIHVEVQQIPWTAAHEKLLTAYVGDGTTYGIPWYVDTRLIFYRSDLLAKAGYKEFPKTWAEWVTAMKKIKSQMLDRQY